MMNYSAIAIEATGWLSTGTFLISILHPKRDRLHQIGLFTAVTTCIYAYAHGATAIWVKWIFAFFFHLYMLLKIRRAAVTTQNPSLVDGAEVRV